MDKKKKESIASCLVEEAFELVEFSRSPENLFQMLAFLDKFRMTVGDAAAFVGAGTMVFPLAGRDEDLSENILPLFENYMRAIAEEDLEVASRGHGVPLLSMALKRSADSPIGAPVFAVSYASRDSALEVVESIDSAQEIIPIFEILAGSLPFVYISEAQGDLRIKIRNIATEITAAVPGINLYEPAANSMVLACGMEISFA
jgi:hypothetical protein